MMNGGKIPFNNPSPTYALLRSRGWIVLNLTGIKVDKEPSLCPRLYFKTLKEYNGKLKGVMECLIC